MELKIGDRVRVVFEPDSELFEGFGTIVGVEAGAYYCYLVDVENDPDDDPDPWPLTREEVFGLAEVLS